MQNSSVCTCVKYAFFPFSCLRGNLDVNLFFCSSCIFCCSSRVCCIWLRNLGDHYIRSIGYKQSLDVHKCYLAALFLALLNIVSLGLWLGYWCLDSSGKSLQLCHAVSSAELRLQNYWELGLKTVQKAENYTKDFSSLISFLRFSFLKGRWVEYLEWNRDALQLST